MDDSNTPATKADLQQVTKQLCSEIQENTAQLRSEIQENTAQLRSELRETAEQSTLRNARHSRPTAVRIAAWVR